MKTRGNRGRYPQNFLKDNKTSPMPVILNSLWKKWWEIGSNFVKVLCKEGSSLVPFVCVTRGVHLLPRLGEGRIQE